MKDDTSAVLQDTSEVYVNHYFANHPLLGQMNMRPDVKINTEAHIKNQMIVIGLKRRGMKAKPEDGSEGVIATPFSSNLFGPSSIFSAANPGQSISYAESSKVNNLKRHEQSFRKRVPTKTESQVENPIALAPVVAPKSSLKIIATTTGSS
jgi:hypothetical protein